MYVSDVYRDMKRAFEGCDEAEIFRRGTEAVRLMNNTGVLDYNLGEMTLCVCNGCITLPRDVGTVLGINVRGQPTLLQDQWFQYHINGPGSQDCVPCGPNSYEMGQVCTFRDPSEPAYLVAEVTSAADNNKKLRVYAYDTNRNKIFTAGPDGTLQEGFLVPLIFGFSQRNPNVPALSSIYRIAKEDTKDYVRLIAINASDGVSQTLIGYYEPNENDPQYRRIKVQNRTSVRIKYKKRDLEIRSQRDWLNTDNRQAFILACRSVKFSGDDKYDQANAAKAQMTMLINEEAEAMRPAGPRVPQIINGVYGDNGDSLYYGGGGYGGGGRWF